MSKPVPKPPRGTLAQPKNRFETTSRERDPEWAEEEERAPATQFIPDLTQSVIAYNDSPDIGFKASLNPYRGCEHGCIYCFARPTHEYLGFSSGLDFETKIMVKERAPELLRQAFSARHWQPQTLALGSVTDPYQPVERRLQLTRRCLEVLAACRNPVCVVTKNQLVTRDLDLLLELAKVQAVSVLISLTTLDNNLRRVMEPRTSPPAARLQTISALAAAGVPVGVLVSPLIPGLNDHEIPRLTQAAAQAGAQFAGSALLRLPYAVAPLFERWLVQHFPERAEKVLGRIRAMRGGKLNDARFGVRFSGEGVLARQMDDLFSVACRRAGLDQPAPHLSTASFRRPAGAQLELGL